MSRSITRGFVSVLGTKLIVLTVGIVTSPLLATLLGEADYGDYSFMLSVFSIFMIFVSSGVTDGVQKFLGEDRADSAWKERVVGFYFRLAVLLGLAGAGAMVWFAQSDLLFRLVDDEQFRRYFYLLGGLVLAAQFRSYARRTLMGFGLEPYAEIVKVTNRLVFVAAGLTLAWLGYGVEGVLAGNIVGSTLSALIGFVFIARQVSVVESLRIAPRSFPRRELLSFNGMSIVLVSLLMSMYHVDVMMIRVLVDGPATAFYKVALILAEFLWVAPMALQMVLVHSTSKLWSQGNHEQISQMTAKITRYSLLFTSLLAVGIGSLAPIAVPMLWPDNYVASLTPLYLLLPGAIGFAVARPILAVGQGKGDLRRLIVATGMAALANVVLNWVLINRYGMHGAAVATSISYGSMFFLHVWSARSLGFDPLSDARLLRVGVTVGVGAPLVVALSRVISEPLLALAIVPVGGLTIFACLALVTGALGLREVLEVAESLPVVGPKAASLKHRIEYSSGVDSVEMFQRVMLVAGVVLVVLGVSAAVTGVPIPVGDSDGAEVPLTTTPEPNQTTNPAEASPTTQPQSPTTPEGPPTGTTAGTTTATDPPPASTPTDTTTEQSDSGSSGSSGSSGGNDQSGDNRDRNDRDRNDRGGNDRGGNGQSGNDSGGNDRNGGDTDEDGDASDSGGDGNTGDSSGDGSDSGGDDPTTTEESTPTTTETTTEATPTTTETTTATTTTETPAATTATTTTETTTATTTADTTTERTTTEAETTTSTTTRATTTETTTENTTATTTETTTAETTTATATTTSSTTTETTTAQTTTETTSSETTTAQTTTTAETTTAETTTTETMSTQRTTTGTTTGTTS